MERFAGQNGPGGIMKVLEYPERMAALLVLASLMVLPASVFAQVPVDDDGNVISRYKSTAAIMPIGNEDIPRLSTTELQELVGPIALYPDDLLAIGARRPRRQRQARRG